MGINAITKQNKLMTIYYFSPNVSDDILNRVYDLTEEECEQLYNTALTEDIEQYEDMQIFEKDFNNQCISDLGFIRIFE